MYVTDLHSEVGSVVFAFAARYKAAKNTRASKAPKTTCYSLFPLQLQCVLFERPRMVHGARGPTPIAHTHGLRPTSLNHGLQHSVTPKTDRQNGILLTKLFTFQDQCLQRTSLCQACAITNVSLQICNCPLLISG